MKNANFELRKSDNYNGNLKVKADKDGDADERGFNKHF